MEVGNRRRTKNALKRTKYCKRRYFLLLLFCSSCVLFQTKRMGHNNTFDRKRTVCCIDWSTLKLLVDATYYTAIIGTHTHSALCCQIWIRV